MQRDNKGILHPVAFFSKTMNNAQQNYDVYNHELLALVEMFRHWRHYLHQPMFKVKVHTDHANLLYWKNPGDHNRRVARWHAELMDYDFKLIHIAGKKNGRANTLSRRSDYEQGNNNNKSLVVLPPQIFSLLELWEVRNSTSTTKGNGDYTMQTWTLTHTNHSRIQSKKTNKKIWTVKNESGPGQTHTSWSN